MSFVTKKIVPRYTLKMPGLKNKSYATASAAYRAQAKRELWLMVSKGKTHMLGKSKDEDMRLTDKWYSLFFKHSLSPECLKCCKDAGPGYFGSYKVFKSCKAGQEKWIRNRIAELREEDKDGR